MSDFAFPASFGGDRASRRSPLQAVTEGDAELGFTQISEIFRSGSELGVPEPVDPEDLGGEPGRGPGGRRAGPGHEGVGVDRLAELDQIGAVAEARGGRCEEVPAVEGGAGPRTTVTDIEGAFQISLLPPGNFKVKISASGMSDWTAESVAASAADTKPLLAVMQLAPTVTSVTVGLSPEELAKEQVKRETQQRVVGIIPNYFVAYNNHAAPLSPRQKFNLSFKTLIDPATFAAVGID